MRQNLTAKKLEKFKSPDGLLLLTGWARAGLTMAQIASNCDVSVATFYKWIAANPEIEDALATGKDAADYVVENALYKSAIGHVVTDYAPDGSEIKRYIAPNITAQIFWLKNRMPQLWRDQRQTEITGGLPVVIKDDIHE